MKNRQLIWLWMVFLALIYGCQDTLKEEPQPELNGSQIQMRFLTVPSMIGNIQLMVFNVPTAGDTVLYQLPPVVSGTALSSPVTLTLPPGNYAIGALANADTRFASLTPGVTRISDAMLAITESASLPGHYDGAGPWFWGINKTIQVGTDLTATIAMKRLIGKAIITYIHADPSLTGLRMSVDGVARQAFLNGRFNTIQGQGVTVTKAVQAISGKVTTDSLILLPTVDTDSHVTLEISRTNNGTPETFSYSSILSAPIKSNYITNIQINGGEQNSVSVTESPWDTNSSIVMLDESPSADIGLGLGDFTLVENDTTGLQSVDILVNIVGGIPSNYTTSFSYTITKTAPTTGSYSATVPMQVVGGKLMTKTSIPLSRGVYQLTSYKLQDAEGTLPDPGAKMQSVSFTVGLAYQKVNVTLDGRQETDNTLLLQACTKLHGTATVGSIFPGTSKYNTRPLPTTYPSAGTSITNSSWYTDVNNYVSLIPIRGEWRVYSLIYRGFATKLTGTLPSELGLLLQTTYIDLQSNILKGGIPSTFSNLSILNTLILTKNSLSGNIDYLGPLTKITRLSLENNSFSGSMQTGLNGCKALLTYFSVNNNNFSGDLNLIFNTASGSLYTSFIFIQNNHFTGKLPPFNIGIGNIPAQCDYRYNDFDCLPTAFSAGILQYRCTPQNSGTVTCRY